MANTKRVNDVGMYCSEMSVSSERRSQWSGWATLLLQRLSSARHSDVPDHHLNTHQMLVDEAEKAGKKDWTPHLLCQFDCVEGTEEFDGTVSWNSGQQHAVKRQLDLNIVLADYIKHRLGKDDQ